MANYTKRLAKIGWGGYNNAAIGAWLRPVERTVRVREVGGSNPLAPTDSVWSPPTRGGDVF
jgi:hypothetical protein